jgi:hypothetical protein
LDSQPHVGGSRIVALHRLLQTPNQPAKPRLLAQVGLSTVFDCTKFDEANQQICLIRGGDFSLTVCFLLSAQQMWDFLQAFLTAKSALESSTISLI